MKSRLAVHLIAAVVTAILFIAVRTYLLYPLLPSVTLVLELVVLIVLLVAQGLVVTRSSTAAIRTPGNNRE